MNSKLSATIAYEIVWKYLKFLRVFKVQDIIERNLIYMTLNYRNFFVISEWRKFLEMLHIWEPV